MIKDIYNYWFQNLDTEIYKRWIPIKSADKVASFEKVNSFSSYLYNKIQFFRDTNHTGRVNHYRELLNSGSNGFTEFLVDFIVLDQFLRTMISNIPDLVKEKEYITVSLGRIIVDIHMDIIDKILSPQLRTNGYEIIFLLMPLKHNLTYTNIGDEIIMDICSNFNEMYHECNYFAKFYNDLCKKYYHNRDIMPLLDVSKYNNKIYNYKIYEYFDSEFFERPLNYNLDNIDTMLLNYIKNILPIDAIICISLSGGVDSMVLTYSLFKLKKLNLITNNINTIHINYGNRPESIKEKRFVSMYAKHLSIDMYTHSIKYIKRSMFSRQLYESITRGIRFGCYRNIIGEKGVILLGHIKDDVIENVITNFSTNKHISNLKKFKFLENIEDVMIGRPFLDIFKEDILSYARKYRIPYLLNTTPDWSNRGKFRNKFIHAFKDQYGLQGIDLIMRSANDINSLSNIVIKMVIKPLLEKFINTNNIILNDDLISNRYIVYTIFEKYFHSKGISTASIKSINNILDNMPCIRRFKIKKNYDLYVNDYNITISQQVSEL